MTRFLSSRLALPVIAVLAFAAMTSISTRYAEATHKLRLAHTKALSAQSATANEARRRVLEKHSQELEQMSGGVVGVASLDPALGIAGWLRGVAVACCPVGTDIRINVDRFTEFDVDVVLRKPIDDQQMATITKCFLGECSEFVNSLRFIVGSEIVAEADKRRIDSIPNWRTVSLEELR